MTDAYPDDIDDDEMGGENRSGVGLNTTLRADPDKASGAFAGGPELGDVNATGQADIQQHKPGVIEPDAQTDVNVDPHWHQPILPKSAKVQP